MSINKVFNADIVDKITSGENAAALVNDQKRALNQAIDVINNVKVASDIITGTDTVQANYSPAELNSAIDSLIDTAVPSGTEAQVIDGTDTAERKYTPSDLNGAINSLVEAVVPDGTKAQIIAGTDTTERKFTPADINGAVKDIAVAQYAGRTAMKAATGLTAGDVVYLSEGGRSGAFEYLVGDYSAEVAADTLEGVYVKLDVVAASVAVLKRVFSGDIALIEWWGASSGNSSDSIESAIKLLSGSYKTLTTNLKSSVLDRPLYFLNASAYGLDIDFSSCDFSLTGARTEGTEFDWEYGAFTFHGGTDAVTQDVTLSADAVENVDRWEVTDSSVFSAGDWVVIETKPNSSSFADKLYWRMVQVVAIESATEIRTDHPRGYTVTSGTLVRFTVVVPVKDISVKLKSISYDRTYSGTSTDKEQASSGVAFYLSSNCHVENFNYIKNPKQAVHFELSHRCTARKVTMRDPIEITSGGYAVQFSKSVYWEVECIDSSEDRHLFDATASSNGRISSSVSTDTSNSGFTTHGTYEHDIDIKNFRGLVQIAGSLSAFGESAKRISGSGGVWTNFRTGNLSGSTLTLAKVYDVTLRDVVINGTSQVNNDGFESYGCQFLGDMTIGNRSTLSGRKSVISGGVATLGTDTINITNSLKMVNVECANFDIGSITSDATGQLTLEDCNVDQNSSSGGRLLVYLSDLNIIRGNFKGIPIRFPDNGLSQRIKIDGAELDINNRTGLNLLDSVKTSGSLDVHFSPRKSVTTGTNDHFNFTTTGATLKVFVGSGCELVAGDVQFTSPAIGSGYYIESGAVFNGTTKTYPAAAANIVFGDSVSI